MEDLGVILEWGVFELAHYQIWLEHVPEILNHTHLYVPCTIGGFVAHPQLVQLY